jgi:hypothetical protein
MNKLKQAAPRGEKRRLVRKTRDFALVAKITILDEFWVCFLLVEKRRIRNRRMTVVCLGLVLVLVLSHLHQHVSFHHPRFIAIYLSFRFWEANLEVLTQDRAEVRILVQ